MSFGADDLADLNDLGISIHSKQSNRISIKNNITQNYSYSDEPIQWIDFSKGFIINPRGLDLWNSIHEDIIVVSVVGKARTGKSYLMNLLLDLIGKGTYGFKVASTLSSCTKGIWLWNNVKTSWNNNTKILFLDTEGTSSTDKSTKTYDSRIFAWVVLISSLFLYNTYSNIDEHGISELSLAAHWSNAITTNSGIDKDELLTEWSPKFIWIIRDFTLDKVHPETGDELSSKEYLELCLKNKRCGKNANDNNWIRQNILKYFPDRDCFTLVRPVDSENELSKLNTIRFDNLKSDFKIELKKLKDKIYKEAKPKKYNGKRLNGPSLACLIEEFVKTINSGKIPNISNSWDNIIEKDINETFYNAVTQYRTSLNKWQLSQNNIYNNEQLLCEWYSYQANAISIFDDLLRTKADTFTHNNYENMYLNARNKLISQLEQFRNKIMVQNKSLSEGFCQTTVVDAFHPMENKLHKNVYTQKSLDDITEDYVIFIKDFDKKGKGLKRGKVLVEFLGKKEKILVDYLVEMMTKESDKEYKRIDNMMKITQNEIDNVENRKQRMEEEVGKMKNNSIEDWELENKKLECEVQEWNETVKLKEIQLMKLKEIKELKTKNKVTWEENQRNMELRQNNQRRNKGEMCRCKCAIF